MSAMLFSSRTRSPSSPGSPLSANPGALRVLEASAALPSPPLPPAAATNPGPAPTRAARTGPSADLATVPSRAPLIRAVPTRPNGAGVEVERGVRLRVALENPAPAAPAVSAVRAAERLELLPVDGH